MGIDLTGNDNAEEKISSEELAALIVDALLRAGIVREDSVQLAVRVAVEEIEARKVMGDY